MVIIKMIKDLVIKFYTQSFRGSITQARRTTEIIKNKCEIEDLNLIREIHFSVSSTLLQSVLLRGEERVRTITERSTLSFGFYYDSIIYTEKWGKNYIRGVAEKIETEDDNEKANLLIGKTLYGSDSEYKSMQTIGDVSFGASSKDLQRFFENSEQIPSKIYINSEEWKPDFKYKAFGYLVQLMPGCEKEVIENVSKSIESSQAFEEISNGTLTENNFKDLFAGIDEEIGYQVSEFEYKCNCSKENMMLFVQKLGISDLQQMCKHSQSILCSHCRELYIITSDEIMSLIAKNPPTS